MSVLDVSGRVRVRFRVRVIVGIRGTQGTKCLGTKRGTKYL